MKIKIIFVLCLYSLFNLPPVYSQARGYAIGEPVKDFKLLDVKDNMVSMAEQGEVKGIIVIFTCNHCPFAKAYEQRIIDLHNKYAEKGFPVIAINSNDPAREPEDSYANMQKRAMEKKYPFPYLFDQTQEVAKAFGARRTPDVFILLKTPKGFELKYSGTIDDNFDEPQNVKVKYVENALEELLNGKPVTLTLTKAIGCSIKWKK
ncbi:MAG: thioredoxin family protein [Bacteroidia bacterium]